MECAYAAVIEDLGYRPRAISGHSLGNLAAAHICGVYDFLTGLELVTHIESLLEELVDGRGQAMGVILGLSEGDVELLLRDGSEDDSGASLANWNGPGQYVIGGKAAAVDGVLAAAVERGAKQSKRLNGERALHTSSIYEVAARLRQYLDSLEMSKPRVPFISCHDASVLRTGDELRNFLAEFLSVAVRWDKTVETLKEGWGSDFVEVGPGNLLSKMLPFIDRTAVIRTASDLLDQKI